MNRETLIYNAATLFFLQYSFSIQLILTEGLKFLEMKRNIELQLLRRAEHS